MREPERDLGRLQDMIQAANHIKTFTEGFSREELFSDKLRFFAVVKNVEIIGEAAYMMSSEFKGKHSEIPWNDIIKMRHVLVHGYTSILPDMLWSAALIEVPILKGQIEDIIASHFPANAGH